MSIDVHFQLKAHFLPENEFLDFFKKITPRSLGWEHEIQSFSYPFIRRISNDDNLFESLFSIIEDDETDFFLVSIIIQLLHSVNPQRVSDWIECNLDKTSFLQFGFDFSNGQISSMFYIYNRLLNIND